MLKAVLFDMDGTITEPGIDWARLRASVGVPPKMPIMEYVERLSGADRARAEEQVRAVEMEAVEGAVLNRGAAELLDQLRARGLRLALVTNNHRRAMMQVVETFSLNFDLLLCREDAPLKPAPDLLLLAMRQFKLAPADCCFVGDGKYDRQASRAAGVRYIHLAHDGAAGDGEPTMGALGELWRHLDV
ncbi:MAG: HAD-IA family hydrolase [Candidatus Latescibacteria bacterium]|nr:HAD-IA family hydrolase [Candidatus Latescibacterota bacterium]